MPHTAQSYSKHFSSPFLRHNNIEHNFTVNQCSLECRKIGHMCCVMMARNTASTTISIFHLAIWIEKIGRWESTFVIRLIHIINCIQQVCLFHSIHTINLSVSTLYFIDSYLNTFHEIFITIKFGTIRYSKLLFIALFTLPHRRTVQIVYGVSFHSFSHTIKEIHGHMMMWYTKEYH